MAELTANSTDEPTSSNKKNKKRNDRIAFLVIWFIIAAVIAVPAYFAGASLTVAVMSGIGAGLIFTGIGKLLDHFNFPSF